MHTQSLEYVVSVCALWYVDTMIIFFIHAVPRLNLTSIETMVTFQFDGTPLLRLSIKVIKGSKECNIVHTIMQILNSMH